MRSITELRHEVLTQEEYEVLIEREMRRFLLKMCTELGYNTKSMAFCNYNNTQLRDRAIMAIREKNCSIQDLKKQVKEGCEKLERQSQIAFNFMEGYCGRKET